MFVRSRITDQVIETIKLQVHRTKICMNDPLMNRISQLTKVRVNSEGYKRLAKLHTIV